MISQRTIAQALGLTHASVSNALNGSGRTSRELSETVIGYARTHGYSGHIRAYGSTPSKLPVQVAGGVVSRATFEWMAEALGWSDCGAFESRARKETV
ncbi:hypothetical protein [Bifidobacterium mongoliense]|uniref:hypothetical protein n=1 Tax=Bifidobacterium mongoliense TaxID=518643 RepID=UPI00264A1FA8|nr:hypothetical protein [Bifidobacterium mongoliense]MDN6024737.1 hypothetical protein [Bifidobacterium mongoliense]MDN6719162.1 hypothetical protein [Bifidobacterium mongoliense]